MRIKAMVWVVIFGLAVAACGGASPANTVGSFLDALASGELEKAATLTTEGKLRLQKTPLSQEDQEKSEELARLIFGKMQYELGDTQIEGDKATVAAAITAPDMGMILRQSIATILPMAFAAAFSDQTDEAKIDSLFMQFFADKLSEEDTPTVTTEVTIQLERRDGTWLIVPDDQLLSALTGRMDEAAKDLSEVFGGDQSQ